MRHALAATLIAALALPATAAADTTIQAVDTADGGRFEPSKVTVKVGEKVTWNFTGTASYHNVASPAGATNWTFESPIAIAGPPVTGAFDTPGHYDFVCRLHAAMTGTVEVRDESGAPPPPPPPPPLSEQPFPNDIAPLTVFERTDEIAPTLSRVTTARVARGARVRFSLSEAGRATVALERGAKTIKTRTVAARAGANTVTLRGLRAGRYRIELRARDLSGNAAATKHARVTVR